jgi:hypothetical protein
MKYEELLKTIIMEGLLAVGIILLMGGGIYYLNILGDDYETQTSVLRREAEVLQQETAELQGKFSKVRKNATLYQAALERQSQGKLGISRQDVRDKFNQYNNEYFLGNLRLTMSGIEELNGDKYKRRHGMIVSSEVNVNFEAISDEYVYDMLNAMQQQMSGSMKVTRISMQRQRGLSEDILRVISQKGTYPLVLGEIRFKWFGMKSLDVEESNAVELLK